MNLLITILTTLIISHAALASAQVFRCQLPISPLGGDFQQGQELYLDVSYQQGEPIVELYRLSGPKLIVHQDQEIKRYGFSPDYSSFLTTWKDSKSYLSMVYLGEKNWGAYLKLDPTQSDFPSESEFMCKELQDITLL